MGQRDERFLHGMKDFYTNRFFSFFLRVFGRFGSGRDNPFFNFGSLAVLSFAVSAVSGIPLLFFYKVDPSEAYNSVVSISREPTTALLRNIHRYSSDAFMLFTVLHLLKTMLSGKFRRILPWLSGVFLLFLAFAEGLTGFLLVWDEKAKAMGVEVVKILSFLPFFDRHIASLFLMGDEKFLSGIFRVSLIFHVIFTVFTAFIFFVHIAKISKPRILPGFRLSVAFCLLIFAVSAIFSASLDPHASSHILPRKTSFDWFYFFPFFLSRSVGEEFVFFAGALGFLSMMALPLLFGVKRKPVINTEICEGCLQCFMDCPYDSIRIREVGGERKVFLVGWSCAGCGICVGSCEVEGIKFEGFPPLPAEPNRTMYIFCSFSDLKKPEKIAEGVISVVVPCVGYLNPRELERSAEKLGEIHIFGCSDCYFRLGSLWESLRLAGKRRPVLKSGKEKIFFHTKKEVGSLGALIPVLLFSFIVPPLSNSSFQYIPPEKSVVVLKGEYLSSPSRFFEFRSELAHMKKITRIPAGRSPILIEIKPHGGKKPIFSRVFKPSGIRREGIIKIYNEIIVDGEDGRLFTISVRELDTGKNLSATFELRKKSTVLIIIGNGKITVRNEKRIQGKE